MKEIISFFKEEDKQRHIMACFIIACVSAAVYYSFGSEAIDACGLGWMTAFIFGAGKEIYDEIKEKRAEVRDWVADIIGYTSGTLFMLWVLWVATR